MDVRVAGVLDDFPLCFAASPTAGAVAIKRRPTAIYMQSRDVIDDMIGIAYNHVVLELDFISVIAVN